MPKPLQIVLVVVLLSALFCEGGAATGQPLALASQSVRQTEGTENPCPSGDCEFVRVDGAETRLDPLGQSTLHQVDSPAQPDETREGSSGWQMVGQVGGRTEDVAMQGTHAYVAVGLRLVVLDVSQPITPTEVGSTTPFPQFVEGVAVSGTLAYVADGVTGLRVVDVSDPSAPVEVGAYDTPGYAEGVAVAGQYAYVADGHYGLRIVDVSDPTHLVEVAYAYPLNYAFDVAADGQYVYLAAAGAILLIVDISDPACPVEVGVCDTQGYAINVAVSSNYAYVGCHLGQMEGLHVVDISDPAHPTRVGYIYSGARDMAVAREIAYMADEWGLRLISVADPMHPTLLGGIELFENLPHSGCTVGVAVSGNLAYVCVEHAGLKIVDVSNPSHPKLIGVEPHFSQEVAVVGHYAYVTTGRGLRVVDVSDPTHPAIVGSYDTPGEATRIVVSADTAYVTDNGGGLQVVDVSDPSNPTLARSYNTPGYVHKVTVVGNHVYVADGDGGLLILEMGGGQSEASKPMGSKPASVVAALGNLAPSEPPTPVFSKPPRSKLRGFISGRSVLGAAAPKLPLAIPPPSKAGGILATFREKTSLIQHGRNRIGGRGQSSPYHQLGTQPTSNIRRIAGTCVVTSTADSGPGTLRECMQNAISGDTITFDPAVFPPTNPVTIALASMLNFLTQGNLTIDASDAGVILDGSGLAEGSGFSLDSNGNVIKGLQIMNFPGSGVILWGAENVIGGDRTRGSGPMGEGNLISGNGRNDPGGGCGVRIAGNSATGNIIIGNFIGTDASGMNALGNRLEGIRVCTSYNRIGGTDPGERNIISGNGWNGVSLNGDDCTGNTIIGNYIGTDASGTADLGNTDIGVVIWVGAFNNLVERNLISGNSGTGVTIYDWAVPITPSSATSSAPMSAARFLYQTAVA